MKLPPWRKKCFVHAMVRINLLWQIYSIVLAFKALYCQNTFVAFHSRESWLLAKDSCMWKWLIWQNIKLNNNLDFLLTSLIWSVIFLSGASGISCNNNTNWYYERVLKTMWMWWMTIFLSVLFSRIESHFGCWESFP